MFNAFAERVGTKAFEDRVRDLAMPVEFGLETMEHFIDWTKNVPVPGHPRRGRVRGLAGRSAPAPEQLEAEAIHVIREVAAELEQPVLLFCGGKDSIVLLRLAEKAFAAGAAAVPGHARRHGPQLPRGRSSSATAASPRRERDRRSVQDSIDKGRVVEETGPRASRNRLQTTTLLDAIAEHGFDAAFGGARRDEERARAKERVFSFRDDFGQWDPRKQRPELWDLYNGRVRRGEHVRVFPLSNWTELDVWEYILAEELEIPAIYFAHEREVFERDGMLYAVSDFVERIDGEEPFTRVGALPHRRRHDAAPAPCARAPRRSTTSWRRSPPRGSPSAARRAPTTACPRPPWKTAREWGTSDAPRRHGGLRRRRQVDADRPAAVRRQGA